MYIHQRTNCDVMAGSSLAKINGKVVVLGRLSRVLDLHTLEQIGHVKHYVGDDWAVKAILRLLFCFSA